MPVYNLNDITGGKCIVSTLKKCPPVTSYYKFPTVS